LEECAGECAAGWKPRFSGAGIGNKLFQSQPWPRSGSATGQEETKISPALSCSKASHGRLAVQPPDKKKQKISPTLSCSKARDGRAGHQPPDKTKTNGAQTGRRMAIR
jgi:hypothetical protein